jgi:hypothetical protein
MTRSVTVQWDEWADEMTTAVGLSRAIGPLAEKGRKEGLITAPMETLHKGSVRTQAGE